MMTEFKRVKHGQQPGDIPKRSKIRLREKRVPVHLFSWQVLSLACAKEFRAYVRDKGPPERRESNLDWVLREMLDVRKALDNLETQLRDSGYLK